MSDSDLSRLNALFDTLDVDRSGVLDLDDIVSLSGASQREVVISKSTEPHDDADVVMYPEM